jgi:hypothetical protein
MHRGGAAAKTRHWHPHRGRYIPQRWEILLRHWFLDQIDKAFVPPAERDVYELDAPRWRQTLHDAGAEVQSSQYVDDWRIMVQHVFTARG